MEIKNLELRQYKGYRDICKTIDDNVNGGKSKQYQLKEWKRYFDWTENTCYNWEITEIHEQVKEKDDGRKNNGGAHNNIYSDHIDAMLLEYIDTYESIQGTFRLFREEFGLRHENFDRLYDEIPELADELNIDIWYLWDFFVVTKRQANIVFDSSLKRLAKAKCILYDKNKIAGANVKGVGNDNKHWEMTDEENEKYNEVRSDLLKEMNSFSEQQIIYSGRWFDYKNELDIRIHNALGIDFIYNSYTVVSYMPFTENQTENLLGMFYDKYNHDEEVDEIDHKKVFNDKMCQKTVDNAIKRHLKAVDDVKNADIGFGDWDIDEATKYRSEETYVDMYRKLVEYFIRVEN